MAHQAGRSNRRQSPISTHTPTAESVSMPRRQRSCAIVSAQEEPGTGSLIARSSASSRISSASTALR
jgi:hypothetical protein